jgi:hypothetical protein
MFQSGANAAAILGRFVGSLRRFGAPGGVRYGESVSKSNRSVLMRFSSSRTDSEDRLVANPPIPTKQFRSLAQSARRSVPSNE